MAGIPNTGTPLSGLVCTSWVLYVVCGVIERPAIIVGVTLASPGASGRGSAGGGEGGSSEATGGISSIVIPSFRFAKSSAFSASTSRAKRFRHSSV